MKIDPDILLAIPAYKEISIQELTKRSNKVDTTVRKNIKDYKKRGWITTTKNNTTKITLTEKGIKAQEIM